MYESQTLCGSGDLSTRLGDLLIFTLNAMKQCYVLVSFQLKLAIEVLMYNHLFKGLAIGVKRHGVAVIDVEGK